MCKVSVNIDEVALRDMIPELDSTSAIRAWVQQIIDLHIQQMEFEDTETVNLETARAILHQTIRQEYARL